MNRDVVVLGGGVVGVAVAYELAMKGASVTVLERGSDIGLECSAGNAGMVTSTHALPLASPTALRQGLQFMWHRDSPFYVRPRGRLLPWLARYGAASTPRKAQRAGDLLVALTQAGLQLHRELADSGIDTSLQRRGLLDAYETTAGVALGRSEVATRRMTGLTGELLSVHELLELEPALSPRLAGGAYYPDEAWCDPLRFTQALGMAAKELGVRFCRRVEALGLEQRNGRVVAARTTAGRVLADEFVLAAGVWSPALANDVGVYLPVEGAKGYHVQVPNGPGTPRLPVYMMEAKVVATPLHGRLRLSGTLELDGLDQRVDPVRVRAIHRAGERLLPAIAGTEPTEVWRGLRPYAPDGLPMIGRVEALPNLVVATGHGMGGMTLAPITARLVAEIMEGREPSLPVEAMRPDRFRRLLARRDEPAASLA